MNWTPYQTFTDNIQRAERFVALYKRNSKGKGRGRTTIMDTDILRAGVVFLHSTVEEYLRTIIRERKIKMLQDDSKWSDVLSEVSLPGKNSGKSSGSKMNLSDLSAFKDLKVFDMVKEALNDKISYMTFNNYSQIVASLKTVEIDLSEETIDHKSINDYIERRHKIVHEADKNTLSGRGNHRTRPINVIQLELWITAIKSFIEIVNNKCSDK